MIKTNDGREVTSIGFCGLALLPPTQDITVIGENRKLSCWFHSPNTPHSISGAAITKDHRAGG